MAERWLTYQQAAEALGMTAEAVRHRARRLGWRTQPGNEGRTLVLLPEGEAVRPPVRSAVQTSVQTGEVSDLAGVLKAQLERERERADKAEARAGQAEVEREAARIASARAESEAAALREERERLLRERDVAQEEAKKLREREAEIQAERERLLWEWDTAQVGRKAAEDELSTWAAGGPLARAWRALIYRRDRP